MSRSDVNPLSLLQEFCTRMGFAQTYEFVGEMGSIRKIFSYTVSVGDFKGHGSGLSKKDARYSAAFDLLKQLADKELILGECLDNLAPVNPVISEEELLKEMQEYEEGPRKPKRRKRSKKARAENGGDSSGDENRKRGLEDGEGNPRRPKKMRRRDRRDQLGYDKDRYQETTYFFERGLRKVHPYNYTYTSFAKARWVGEKLIDVFTKEFQAFSKEAYEKHITTGQTTVNEETMTPDYLVGKGDFIANTVHRHEDPVSGAEVHIIHKDDQLVVLNKPPSIATHPSGRFRHNTVLFILAKEHGLEQLFTIHRMDRLSSGLLMFALTQEKEKEMQRQMNKEHVLRKYVCRVKGEFPEEDKDVVQPLKTISRKVRVCKVAKEGKECWTTFKRLSYNGRTSVVQCETRHDRMHQIRVHLQFLGFPVLNDLLYSDSAFGPERGKNGNIDKSDDDLLTALVRSPKVIHWLDAVSDLKTLDEVQELSTIRQIKEEDGVKREKASFYSPGCRRGFANPADEAKAKESKDEDCLECSTLALDPLPQELLMYIHAFNYEGPDWEYSAPMPPWASENWVEPPGLL